jgi:glycosyltransferase involved in cell wall biosynthesis
LKVLHFVHGYAPEGVGGVEGHVRTLAAALHSAGTDVVVVAGSLIRQETDFEETLIVDGVRVRRVHRDDLWFDHYAKARHAGVGAVIDAILAQERPDVVHVHQWIRLTNDLVAIAAQRGIPAVVSLHDLWTSCPRCFRVRRDDASCARPLTVADCGPCVPRFGHESEAEVALGIELHRERFQDELRRAARVLVASRFVAATLEATTGWPSERCVVQPLPIGVDVARVPAMRRDDDGVVRFVHFGGLSRHKGVHVLLDAFARLHAAVPGRVRLDVFGAAATREYGDELGRAAQGLPVTFHGGYADLVGVAAAAPDVAVFPSLSMETYGLVVDEALALGLPVVVSRIGALPERIDGVGFAVAPGDPVAWAAGLRRFVDEPGLRAALAASLPRAPLAASDYATRMQGIYRDAITAGPTPAAPFDESRAHRLVELQRESLLARVAPPHGPA